MVAGLQSGDGNTEFVPPWCHPESPQVDALGLFPQLRLSFKPSVLAAGHGVQAGHKPGTAHEPLLQKGCELSLRAPNLPVTGRFRSKQTAASSTATMAVSHHPPVMVFSFLWLWMTHLTPFGRLEREGEGQLSLGTWKDVIGRVYLIF